MNQYLVSTAILPKAIGKEFTDFTSIPIAASKLDIDGVEFVFLPEWDAKHPPITPTSANLETSMKASVSEITHFIKNHNLKVPSVHLNRDIGNLLCSSDTNLVRRGQKILEENLEAAIELNSEITVLHLWDTFKEHIDLKDLFNKVYEVSQSFSTKITIENVPISDKSLTMKAVWETLKEMMPNHYGFTLDLNWCSLYDNFNSLKSQLSSVYNVHVQGYFNDHNQFIPRVGTLDLIKSLKEIKELNYNHYITIELNRARSVEDFINALNLVKDHH